jgi:hypothetical protein
LFFVFIDLYLIQILSIPDFRASQHMSGRARMRPAAGVDDFRTRKKSEKGSDNGVSRPAGGQVRTVDHVGKAESVPPKQPAVAWPADALKAHSWTRARCQTGQG